MKQFYSYIIRFAHRHVIILSLLTLLVVSCNSSEPRTSKEGIITSKKKPSINVYSARNYKIDLELYQQFERQTGIKVILTKDKGSKLIQKIKEDGQSSKADVLIFLDAGRLQYAANTGMFQSVKTEPLEENVPLVSRHPERLWFGLGKRARVLVYNREKVKVEELGTYEDLAHPKWSSELNISPSAYISNRSLLASMLANGGEDAITSWVNGVAANLTKPSSGRDIDQVLAVAQGEGCIAIANTNAIGKFFELQKQASRKIGVFFPNQSTSGTHINFSGMGVLANAPNKKYAIKLLVFLTSRKAQMQLTNQNFEYPVHPNVEAAPILQSWGEYKADDLDFNFLESNHGKVVELLGVKSW
jgi:iron(III) transport system substrate-binding protein